METESAEGFKLDDTPHYFEVKNGETTVLQVENTPVSAILIHKTDSTTGEGIYGASFLLYDSANTPIGQYTSDDRGYVLIEGLEAGRYYLRELENEGTSPTRRKDRLCGVRGNHRGGVGEYPHHWTDPDNQDLRGLQQRQRLARRHPHPRHGV